jgi:hypothetical protein
MVDGINGIYWATSEFVLDKSSPLGYSPKNGAKGYLNSEDYGSDLIIIAQHYGGIDGGEFCCLNPGDADHNHSINLLDVVYLIGYLYGNGPAPECYHEGDADGNGFINILDITYLIGYLYAGGPAPVCPSN